MHEAFRTFAVHFSRAVGSVWAFLALITVVAVTGMWSGFSSEWKTTISCTIAVISLSALIFLQKSQIHNDRATHLKLDELIKSIDGARDEVAAVETSGEKELERLAQDKAAAKPSGQVESQNALAEPQRV